MVGRRRFNNRIVDELFSSLKFDGVTWRTVRNELMRIPLVAWFVDKYSICKSIFTSNVLKFTVFWTIHFLIWVSLIIVFIIMYHYFLKGEVRIAP